MLNNSTLQQKDLTKKAKNGKAEIVECYACHKRLFDKKDNTIIAQCKCGKKNYITIK